MCFFAAMNFYALQYSNQYFQVNEFRFFLAILVHYAVRKSQVITLVLIFLSLKNLIFLFDVDVQDCMMTASVF